jgi:hypothetical protein
VFSKAGAGAEKYVEIARGTWIVGREPILTGEAVPPEVLKGFEKEALAACDRPKGTVRFARAEVLYAMDFEAAGEPAPGSLP